jgi:uncharacterized protein involved in exopolysaccharide biosynthesis
MTDTSNQVEFNLIAVIQRVLRGKYVLLATTLFGAVIAIVAAHVTKPWYYSQSQFLPPRYNDLTGGSPSALLLGGGADASDLYLGLLVSRSVQDDVVNHLNLKAVYHTPSQTAARFLLQKDSSFGVGRNSLVFVTVKASDPKLAADIANTYLDALYRLNGEMVSSSSDARRLFFQQQLTAQRAELEQAELALKQTEEKTGLVLPTGEAQAGLNATAQIQAQLDAAEDRLAGLLVGFTDQNPQVIQARAQIVQLRSQLARQQRDDHPESAGIPPNSQLPGLTLEVEEKERDVRAAQSSYDTLLQQYGKARLASIDPGPQLEVVDRAVPSEFKAGPNGQRLLEYGVGIGFLLGLLYLLFFEPLRRMLRVYRAYPSTQPR